jgi:hypothetical protein
MGLTGSNVPSANVYNAGAFVSPLISPAQTPRFLFLGGQASEPLLNRTAHTLRGHRSAPRKPQPVCHLSKNASPESEFLVQ